MRSIHNASSSPLFAELSESQTELSRRAFLISTATIGGGLTLSIAFPDLAGAAQQGSAPEAKSAAEIGGLSQSWREGGGNYFQP